MTGRNVGLLSRDQEARNRRLAWARRPYTLAVPRSPLHPVGAGHGQCPLDALDAANECPGCLRLPHEGCRCNVVTLTPQTVQNREAA